MSLYLNNDECLAIITTEHTDQSDLNNLVSSDPVLGRRYFNCNIYLRVGYLILDYRESEDKEGVQKQLESMKLSFFGSKPKYRDFDDFALDHLHDKFFQDLQ